MAKVYVLKSPEELLLLWSERRAKDVVEGDNVEKLLAFFCGQKQEPGIRRPGDLEREKG